MFRYIVRRLLQIIPVFIGTTFLVYWLMFAAASDPVQALAGERPVSEAQRQALEEEFHLNDPFLVQYGYYLRQLLSFDLGRNYTGRDISELIGTALPYTIKMALIAFLFLILFGVTAGIISGIRRRGVFDNSVLVLTLLVISVPIFVLGGMLQFLLAVKWRIFPVTATAGTFYSLLLPGMVLGALGLATTARLTRTSIAENLRADYVRTARAKGLGNFRVTGVHVLRNSLIPVVTYLGAVFGDLMAGAIVTERIFNVPGIGFMTFRAIRTEDGATVVGIVSLLVIAYLLLNLIVDVMYAVLDPRIRYD